MVTHNMGDMKYRMLYIDLKRLLEAGKYSEFRTEMEDTLAEGYPIDEFYPDKNKN